MHEIGWVETCYDEKFGVPRQSGVVGSAWGKITFHEDYQGVDFIRGLDGFSHLWLVFLFHQSFKEEERKSVKATVRPPRLGGNEKVGVFASRSPFRPNPIGLSLVKLERIEMREEGGCILHVSGVDLVSGTSLLDIKPYISYCDSVTEAGSDSSRLQARTGYVSGPPEQIPVEWADGIVIDEELRKLISETISLDPRPAYHGDDREYGCLIEGVNVRWKVVEAPEKVVKILSCAKH